MLKTRTEKARFSMITSILNQLISIICGFFIPRIMIGHFGSEIYGATTSITQFLSYITLLDGGIGAVAKAALYKPLADNDIVGVSSVYTAIKKFFNVIAIVFMVYTIAIGIIYKYIVDITFFDRTFTFFLVLVISISTIAQYFFGVANQTLLNADQKPYIGYVANTITVCINAAMVVILIKLNCNIIIVKLFSGLIYILKPLFFSFYVKKHYNIVPIEKEKIDKLEQKWTGLGQHLAYFLHCNTDVFLLTLFSDLKTVSVYSVYSLVSGSIKNIVFSFTGGMESIFGNMIAKKETHNLRKTFGYYNTLISTISIIFFSVAISLSIPFVRLYTAGITDANYIQPIFAILLIGSELIYCLRLPYNSIVSAGNRFKQTRGAAYSEAIINIIVSSILVSKLGLVGVAIGTNLSMLFRFIYYMIYLSKHILHMSIFVFIKRLSVNITGVSISVILGNYILNFFSIEDFFVWIICGVILFACSTIITVLWISIWYKKDLSAIFSKIHPKRTK